MCACREANPQPWPDTERPPPPLRSPAFAQILDHKSGLGLSIHSVAAAASDWAKLKYGAKRGVPLLLYHRVVDELGCAPPRVHLCTAALARAWALCTAALTRAWSAHVHVCGRSFTGALSRALYAVRWQVVQQRPGRRIEACPLGRQPPVRRQWKQGEVSGPVRGWPRAVRRGAEGERRAPGVGGVAGAHIPPLRLVWHSLAHSLTHSLTQVDGKEDGRSGCKVEEKKRRKQQQVKPEEETQVSEMVEHVHSVGRSLSGGVPCAGAFLERGRSFSPDWCGTFRTLRSLAHSLTHSLRWMARTRAKRRRRSRRRR